MKPIRYILLPILCFGFTCLLAVLSADTSPADTADLTLVNGRVWTGGDAASFVEAVAIRGNRILRVGTTAEIRQLAGEGTQLIDLGGRFVAPGFNDAHIHFLGGASGLNEIDLTGCKTVAEMVGRIADFAKKNPDRPWLTGRGWEYTPFPGGLPTKTYLDAIIKDRPVFLSAYDGHSGWANSKALQLAEINSQTKFTGYGEIVRDAAGEPTGALKEGAQSLVRRLIPSPTREQKLDALRQGLKLAASLGITSLQNAGGTADEFSLYEELLQKGELTARFSMAFSAGERTTQQQIDGFLALKKKYDIHPMLRAASIKFVLDGVIESHTAAMLERYSDLPASSGIPYGETTMPPDIYRDLVAKFDKLGFQIYTHAIGDRAVREALNAYELAQQTEPRRVRRHRIEHIETVSPTDIPRFAKLDVLASMEPIHADPGTTDVWSKAVGAERLPFAFAWQSLLKSGAKLVYSSDWPAAISVDPIRGLHSAANRRTVDGQPPRGWVPAERISIVDALRAYTHGGAYSSFEEGIKGRIAPGMLADIAVFSQDLFKVEPIRIHETKVVLTVFNGKVIYRDGKL
ncbi:MAG TPA: amidohydrolase [Blastocatellia bacterium]|nr:amidohydrolase [Blastocatellia bacterium]HMY74058.1 amidohydrolase [Blastocatellia bacterium]HMZ21137.1 amidohydrolase [Blastocatellia bacterium]HNG31073.1 amidohydrolase [Blastocatellia bacterium]